jgi:hypothetical protein
MYKIRITAAIEYYNMNIQDEKTLTREILAGIILPDLQQKTAEQYLSSWNNGKKMSALKPDHIHGICEVTGVDANFLYGINK